MTVALGVKSRLIPLSPVSVLLDAFVTLWLKRRTPSYGDENIFIYYMCCLGLHRGCLWVTRPWNMALWFLFCVLNFLVPRSNTRNIASCYVCSRVCPVYPCVILRVIWHRVVCSLCFTCLAFATFSRTMSQCTGAVMFCLGWLSLAVLYWFVSRFRARLILRKYRT